MNEVSVKRRSSVASSKKNSILSNGSRPSINLSTANGNVASTGPEPDRGNWSNPLEFVLACVGYAVGLGNVWRFPYLVFRNGGGAFLVPYILMVFVIGLPIFFAELFVGQYPGQGPIKAYLNLAPFFHGLGYCTLVVIFFVTIYYMVVMAWIFFYFFASFSSELGWGYCNNEFNTKDCFSGLQNQKCTENNSGTADDQLYWNRTCNTVRTVCENFNLQGLNETYCKNGTATGAASFVPIRTLVKRVLASEEYYYEYVLGIGDATWYNWGYPRWQLVLCLLLGWLIAFFCLIRGVKSAGKVVYFTALFPYVILTALLIRGATLEGAAEGIMFYIQPQWETLLQPHVWGDAASQIFYSFGLACGSLVTFSSYNHFKNNCHTDAIVVSFTNVFTAIFAGFAVFSILGFMAHNIEAPVAEVVQTGPGLAFIAYPEAVLLMPLPQLWSVLFFLMMLILGMGSQFGGIEALCTAVIDHWPHLRDHRWRVTAGVCIVCFIAALPLVCNGGVYMFTLMEWHTASWAILLLGLAEVVVISWVYGMRRTFKNLHEMGIKMNRYVRAYWWGVWVIVSPVASVGVFIFTMTDIGPTQFRDDFFPAWADSLGWMMGAATLAPLPIFLIYRYAKSGQKREFSYFVHSLFKPTPDWKPQDPAFVSSMTEKPTPRVSGIENAAYNPA